MSSGTRPTGDSFEMMESVIDILQKKVSGRRTIKLVLVAKELKEC
jgi:hypothetical protein